MLRGAIIHAHVDEPGVGGEAIATAVIAGASEVRLVILMVEYSANLLL